MNDGYPSDAASKIYYSMYCAAQALLRSEGIDVIRHSAVESAFGYYFAKMGKIDPRQENYRESVAIRLAFF